MSNNNSSPFTSNGYPFSKELNSYDAESLGRAFFADELVDSFGGMHFFDQAAVFEKQQVQLSDEPYYYQNKAIPIYIYTTNKQDELNDKYKKLDVKAIEIGIFCLVKQTGIAFTPKIGNDLLQLVQNSQATNTPDYYVEITNEELGSKKISAKWFIDLFATANQPLFNALNVATKQQMNEDREFVFGETPKTKPFIKAKPSPPKTVDITVGVFFDGTGNNRYCSELIYYQFLKDAGSELSNLQIERVLDIKKVDEYSKIIEKNIDMYVNIPTTNKSYKVEDYMVPRNYDTSYLNPYSNIVLLHDLYPTTAYNPNSSKQQDIYLRQYVQGIGTKVDLDENGVPTKYYKEDIIGSASGIGSRGILGRVEESIRDIVKQIQKVVVQNNVTISSITFNCFGFSRGAAAARHFANEVLLPERTETVHIIPENESGTPMESEAYNETKIIPKGGYLGKQLVTAQIEIPKTIAVRYIGLFDTVLSLILASKPFEATLMTAYQATKDWESVAHLINDEDGKKINLSLKNINANVHHIVAMNEYRKNFPLTIIDSEFGATLRLYGSHSDIGGGYAETNYDTIVEFRDIKTDEELNEFEKVAISYKNRFARVKNKIGNWDYDENQIELKKAGEHIYNQVYERNIIQSHLKISDHYQIIDHRFISNKLSLVALHAMLTHANNQGLNFNKYDSLPEKNITKIPTKDLYEIPDVDFLQEYHKRVQDIVNTGNKEYLPSPEVFYPLFKNYVHLSANYNEAKLLGTKGWEVFDKDLYVNLPTDDKVRVIYKPI